MSILFPLKKRLSKCPYVNLSDKLDISAETDMMALVIYGHFLQEMLSSHDVRHSKIKSSKLAYSLRQDIHWSTTSAGEEGATQCPHYSVSTQLSPCFVRDQPQPLRAVSMPNCKPHFAISQNSYKPQLQGMCLLFYLWNGYSERIFTIVVICNPLANFPNWGKKKFTCNVNFSISHLKGR